MPHRLVVLDVNRCVGCELCMYACSRRYGEGGLAKSAIHVRSIGGAERGFTVIVCRACQDPPCARACPEDALIRRDGGGVLLNASKCNGCRVCVSACPFGAIFWDHSIEKPIICVYCGYCVDYCPYNILELEEIAYARE